MSLLIRFFFKKTFGLEIFDRLSDSFFSRCRRTRRVLVVPSPWIREERIEAIFSLNYEKCKPIARW